MIGYSSSKPHRTTLGPGTPASVYYRRRQQRRRQRVAADGAASTMPTFEEIVHHENLLRIFHDLKYNAGQAPGPDGLTYADLGRSEVAQILRVVSRALLKGTYRPYPARLVAIPKPSGGRRTLRICGIIDRVVGKALDKALSPYWDSTFLPWSLGFRSGCSAWGLLAELEGVMRREDLWVLTVDDVKQAFDHLDIDDVMADHARDITDARLLNLIEVVLRGGDRKRKIGVDQGAAYSPTVLNIRLHNAHDLGAKQGHHPLIWYRYADNHVYLTRTVAEGRQALDHARALLAQAGLSFKGPTNSQGTEGRPVDLARGGKVQLLGFTLSRKVDHLHLDLGKDAWKGLVTALIKAHETDNPVEIAGMAVTNWINAYGPAFESKRDDVPLRVLENAAHHGFRETYSLEDLKRQWQSSWKRWQALRRETQRSPKDLISQRERVGAAAPPATVEPGGD